MASLLSPRRADPAISLQASVRQTRQHRPDQRDPDPALLGWFPLGLAGGVLSSLTGWVLIAGTVVLGWLAAEPGTLHQSLAVGTRVWLLSNGLGTRMGTVSVTIVPWGATAVFAFLVYRSAAFAARRGKRRPSTRLMAISAATTAGYLAPVVVLALANENGWSSLPRFGLVRFGLVALVVWLAAALGVGRARREEPTGRWPRWASDLARGVLGAQLVMLVAGSAVLASALIGNISRIVELTSVLNAGIAGGVALLFLQLAIAPNAVVWAGSYALGAGFSIGSGSVVAPAGTELGMLPGLPLLGGLPASGAGSVTQLWWLAGGVVAGALAALIVVRRRRQARFDETALLGGICGVLAGLVFVCLAWASGGDLGAARLTALGPRLLPLLIMAPTTMGLAGVIVGFCFGLLRRRPR